MSKGIALLPLAAWAILGSAAHAQTYGATGRGFRWQGSVPVKAGVLNPATGNRLTVVPLQSWNARGGRLTVDFTLYHNSLADGAAASDISPKWSHTYAISLKQANANGDMTVRWGDGTAYTFTPSSGGGGPTASGAFNAPAGVFDTLTLVTSASTIGGPPAPVTYKLTTKNQITYKFEDFTGVTGATGGVYWCTKISDRNGNAITINRDAATGRLNTVADPTGRTLTFAYDVGTGKMNGVTDPSGNTWTLGYWTTAPNTGDLRFCASPASNGGVIASQQFTYGGDHDIAQYQNPEGAAWAVNYDAQNRETGETDPLTWGRVFTYGAGAYGTSYTDVKNERNYTERYSYDPLGRLSSHRDFAGNLATNTAYDSGNNVRLVRDHAGKLWEYTFDNKGNPLTKTDPLSHTWTYTWTAQNDIASVTSPAPSASAPQGFVTTYAYDNVGNLSGSGTSDPNQTTGSGGGTGGTSGGAPVASEQIGPILYDTWGQRTSVTVGSSSDGSLATTTYDYDANGNLAHLYAPQGRTTTYVCDAVGQVTSVTDPGGLQTATVYDALGRATSVSKPGGRIWSYSYDRNNRVVSVSDPMGKSDTYVYNVVGRVASHTDRNGNVVSYAYDGAKNKIAFTNGKGKVTTYSYAPNNKLAGIAYPDGTGDAFTYTATGKLWQKTDGRGVTVTRAYDDAGRITAITYPSGSGASNVSLAYDNANRKIGMTDGTGTTVYEYDASDRITKRAAPAGTVEFTFDLVGHTKTRSLNGVATTFTYDNADRMTSVVAAGATTTYAYNLNDRITNITQANGATKTNSYDPLTGDLAQVWHKNSSGATLSKHAYAYDGMGRRNAETFTDDNAISEAIAYGYDDAGQLTQETHGGQIIGYGYDESGNRVSKSVAYSHPPNSTGLPTLRTQYTYDDADKLLTAGGKSYAYDGAGNVTSVTDNGVTTTLTWDAEERLKTVTVGSSSSAYTYNGLGQRVAKTENNATNAYTFASNAIDARILSDGAATYVYGLGLLFEQRGGVTRFYHTDALGSTREMTSSTQAVTDKFATDAFGNTIAASGTTPTPWGFAGQWGYQSDATSGLMLLGYRYYDASAGRFISRDPIRDGSNWYSYVSNNPVSRIDPSGLGFNLFAPTTWFNYWGKGEPTVASSSYDPTKPIITTQTPQEKAAWEVDKERITLQAEAEFTPEEGLNTITPTQADADFIKDESARQAAEAAERAAIGRMGDGGEGEE